jgi:hypothetical protein
VSAPSRIEVVVTLTPDSPRWVFAGPEAVAVAASEAVDALLWGPTLRGRGFRLDGHAHAQAASRRPEVVCLCGSTRFYDAFQRATYELTMQGRIVLSVGVFPHSAERAHGESAGCTPEQKAALDELHLRKLDISDRVLVLNVGGYIGESTRREIAYATRRGTPIQYLEPPSMTAGVAGVVARGPA